MRAREVALWRMLELASSQSGHENGDLVQTLRISHIVPRGCKLQVDEGWAQDEGRTQVEGWTQDEGWTHDEGCHRDGKICLVALWATIINAT